MKDIQVSLKLHQCQIKDVADVQSVAHVMLKRGFVFLHDKQPVQDEKIDVLIKSEKYRISASDEKTGRPIKWSVQFSGVPNDMRELVGSMMRFDQLDLHRNQLVIGALADFEFKDQRHYVEPFAQQLKDFGLALYPLVQPTLGWVDESFSNETATKESLKLKLRSISWLNFFGPAYVEKYGRDFLLGLPGYKTELLPDGGVFHQLSPTFVAPSEAEAKRLRQAVIAYCAQHGLKVTCRAPYVIPGLTAPPEPKEPPSDAELQEYLRQALSVTLVLTDSTRVKPISIPWEDLTPQQRRMAVEAIKQAAIAEIQRPGRKRIRFEFNAIPDELDRMLADLAGWDNPDVEWVQVEMGEGT